MYIDNGYTVVVLANRGWGTGQRIKYRVQNLRVLSVTGLDLSHALPADLFRCHARSPKGHTASDSPVTVDVTLKVDWLFNTGSVVLVKRYVE